MPIDKIIIINIILYYKENMNGGDCCVHLQQPTIPMMFCHIQVVVCAEKSLFNIYNCVRDHSVTVSF